ncbi:MAG: HAMP domain-containing sensor histidine kinase [bacterium]|nr:HAMP domain-containing sensor histidine kinase [bacterium]
MNVMDKQTATRGRKMGMEPENQVRVFLGDWKVRLSSHRLFSAYFFLSGMTIVLAFLVYAQLFVVRPMRSEAKRMGELYAFLYSLTTVDVIEVKPGSFYMNTIFETVQNTNFPVVITDEQGKPRYWQAVGIDWGDHSPDALARLRRIAAQLDQAYRPLPFEYPDTELGPDNKPKSSENKIWMLHYGESSLVKRLSWLPFVALLVTLLFVGIGYVAFQHIKNSEARSIWVGMARETAHQLGTPLSSLYGWMELMKAEVDEMDVPEVSGRLKQVVEEMAQDTSRLNQIASRFSLIGSTPELRLAQVQDVISKTVAYLRHRLPSDVQIVNSLAEIPVLPLNDELLGWAFENLFKNAADAMEEKDGRIEISSELHEDRVDILVMDNGKGIPPHLVKQVFLPGYSTKKRGWGLGLAFVKRIVEEYHNGKIVVKESTPGEGTTFLVTLPFVKT